MIIPCPECNAKVSNSAPTCPSCGIPIERHSPIHGALQTLGALMAIVATITLCDTTLSWVDGLLIPGVLLFAIGRFAAH